MGEKQHYKAAVLTLLPVLVVKNCGRWPRNVKADSCSNTTGECSRGPSQQDLKPKLQLIASKGGDMESVLFWLILGCMQ